MYTDGMAFSNYLEETKSKIQVATSMPQHPTGFMYLDYGVGSYMNVYDDDETPIYTYHNIGITSGSVNVLVSKSQGGKTTLAIEMGVAIIEPYITKCLYERFINDNIAKITKGKKAQTAIEDEGYPFIQILDTEKTLPIDYVKKISGYPNKLLKRHVMINPITTDRDLMDVIAAHVKYKVAHMKMAVNPMLDVYGGTILEYPPTVLIVDSMSQLLLEEVDDVEKATKKGSIEGMYESAIKGPAGALRAKKISALYSQLVNYAKRYNIIIFSINHINKMPAIMGIPVKQYRGLRAGETIGGGERAIYLASNILRLDVIKSIGGQSASSIQLGEGITGHIAIASWIKSKSNSKSNSCQLAYTNEGGYNQLLSGLWFGKEKGDLAKSGNYYYLNGRPDLKFTMKNYKEVFAANPEMFSLYYDQTRDQCEKMLDNPDKAVENHKKLMETIRKDIAEDDSFDRNSAHDMDDIFSELMND